MRDEVALTKAITAFNQQRTKVGKLPGDARTAKWWRQLELATAELARRAAKVAEELER